LAGAGLSSLVGAPGRSQAAQRVAKAGGVSFIGSKRARTRLPTSAKGAEHAFGGNSGADQNKIMRPGSRHIPAAFATLTPSFMRPTIRRHFNYRLTI
jgi:hypothetical protein